MLSWTPLNSPDPWEQPWYREWDLQSHFRDGTPDTQRDEGSFPRLAGVSVGSGNPGSSPGRALAVDSCGVRLQAQ